MHSELKDFIEISKYAGERFDLIQAGGGNSSVKMVDGTMLIKASGFYLSEIEENFAYTVVKNEELLKIFNEETIISEADKRTKDILCTKYVSKYNLMDKYRPSIETLLHSLLKKYVLHTHPVVVNAIVSRSDWREVLTNLFARDTVLLVDYKTPGFELACELKHKLNNINPDIIFLQNHGLIITSDKKAEIINLTEYVISKIERYLNVDMEKYKLTNKLSNQINKYSNENYIAYLSQDEYLKEHINDKYMYSLPFCPDKMVYCGVKSIACLNNLDLEIKTYKNQYCDIPRVIVYKNNLFFIAKNTKKAKEIEEVLKFHLMSLNMGSENINYLNSEEIKYIGNWEAEKYRQKL